MDGINLEDLKCSDITKNKSFLRQFSDTHATLFDFIEFSANGQWLSTWNALFEALRDPAKQSIQRECLSCIRILTRDKNNIMSQPIQSDFEYLIKLAYLEPESLNELKDEAIPIAIEALKCLCNIVFLSAQCQKLCLKNCVSDGILKRVSSATTYPHEIEYFDMKLLFLVTALAPQARTKVRDDLNGLMYLTEWLDLKVKITTRTDEQLDLIIEILKVMFNITANLDETPNGNANEIQCRRLTAVVRSILFDFGDMSNDKAKCVITHTINLLTNISIACFSELLAKTKDSKSDEEIFEGKCIRSLAVILRYLKMTLDETETNSSALEQVPPVLTVLIKCARCNPLMRHYIRSIILPPLKDVRNRPEIGQETRNYLCRFLTLPNVTVRDLSADLLFVCCKENVGRMIKYTGYGNAAGLLAARGILDCRRIENTEYSSESEDSDTEEYKNLQHGINPVLGCYEPPKKNPLEGMSEEQKEYEAMKLVELIDQLHKSGVVQPCRIGEDGKPQPVDHILQLQEELPQQQLEQKRKT